MIYQQTATLMANLQTELTRLNYWQTDPLPASAFASTAPFCCDTMTLQQWLQFVFMPKMLQLIIEQQPLPRKIAIAPFAEIAFANESSTVQPLIQLLKEIDTLLSSQH